MIFYFFYCFIFVSLHVPLCVCVCQTNKLPHYAASVVGLQEAVKEDRGMIAL